MTAEIVSHDTYQRSFFVFLSSKFAISDRTGLTTHSHKYNNLTTSLLYELYADGLMNTGNLNVTMSSRGMADKRTTSLGDKFIKFISQPNA